MAMADPDNGDSESTVVVCEHCGYEWTYSGEMWRATCPRCGKKTDTGLKPDEFE